MTQRAVIFIAMSIYSEGLEQCSRGNLYKLQNLFEIVRNLELDLGTHDCGSV